MSDLRLVKLTQGYVALVDAADYDRISERRWTVEVRPTNLYARSTRKRDRVYLHNFIMGARGVDHISGNGLDNRRRNLRLATQRENVRNKRIRFANTVSRFKGVTYHKEGRKRWQARITVDYRCISLGYYATDAEAALAYNEGARRYFGEFARLNVL